MRMVSSATLFLGTLIPLALAVPAPVEGVVDSSCNPVCSMPWKERDAVVVAERAPEPAPIVVAPIEVTVVERDGNEEDCGNSPSCVTGAKKAKRAPVPVPAPAPVDVIDDCGNSPSCVGGGRMKAKAKRVDVVDDCGNSPSCVTGAKVRREVSVVEDCGNSPNCVGGGRKREESIIEDCGSSPGCNHGWKS